MAEVKPKKRVTIVDLVKECVRFEEKLACCAIDPLSNCRYSQSKFDSGNFMRHFKTQHPAAAKQRNLTKIDAPSKKSKTIPKLPVAINNQIFLEGCIKLVTQHHLPLTCFEWEGMKLIIDPIAEALDVTVNRKNIKIHLEVAANRIKQAIINEMRGKLISVKLDSASRHHRHILGINVQYEMENQAVIRTLAMVEVKQSQTAKFLKEKILDILSSYGVSIHQIFSVTTDNGANMIAAIKQLKTTVLNLLLDEEETDTEEMEAEFLEALVTEFNNHLSLVRCAVHTLQLAVGDVVKKNDEGIRKITQIVKETRKTKYTLHFEHKQASKAPLWCVTRWGGRYEMVKSIVTQETFYKDLGQEHTEVEFLEEDWIYMKHFVNAFRPVHELTKNMQQKQCSLSDFYIQWLQATCAIEKDTNNPFSSPLVKALNDRLKMLMDNMAFKAAVYLDPRLNFLGSNMFASATDKEVTMNFIINTWTRIKNLTSVSTASTSTNVQPTQGQTCEDASIDLENYITRMIGGSSAYASTTSFQLQLRQMEIEPRQPHNFDVWNHWIARKHTHPELFSVAMVVLSTPSSQVSVERAFSALALVLSDLRTGISEKTLENILLIKLNKELFQRIIYSMYEWKTVSLACKTEPSV